MIDGSEKLKPLDEDWISEFVMISLKNAIIPNSTESWNWVQKVEIKLIDRKVPKARQNKMGAAVKVAEVWRKQKHIDFDRFMHSLGDLTKIISIQTKVLANEDFLTSLTRQLVLKEDYKHELKLHISAHTYTLRLLLLAATNFSDFSELCQSR